MYETQIRVADVMTIDPIVVDVEAKIEDVDRLLRASFITGLPVVDGNGTLVGVIAQSDLVKYRFAGTPRSNST